MAIHDIARMGAPILKVPAETVVDPADPAIAALVADMEETMAAAGGVGLAAPQIGVGLRVVIFEVPAARTEDGVGLPLAALINPEIEPLGDEKVSAYEGCLSVPGLTGLVPRFARIRYRGIALDGSKVDRVADGFHARVVQHECDHLDGVLYPMRMEDMSTLAFIDEKRREFEGREDEPEMAEADIE